MPARHTHGGGLVPLPLQAPGWQTLRLGDGGEVQSFNFQPDGTALCRTDTYGAYRLNRMTGLWSQLCSTSSLPLSVYSVGTAGVYEIVAAPSNTSRFYMFFLGFLLRSDN